MIKSGAVEILKKKIQLILNFFYTIKEIYDAGGVIDETKGNEG